jgi:hypothetical protein
MVRFQKMKVLAVLICFVTMIFNPLKPAGEYVRRIEREVETEMRPYPEVWRKWAKEAADIHGGDPMLYIAIACHESAYGTSRVAVEKNNLHGITGYKNGKYYHRSFVDGSESFRYVAWLLNNSSLYKDVKNNIAGIGAIYCPIDPKWADSVQSIYNDLKGETYSD